MIHSCYVMEDCYFLCHLRSLSDLKCVVFGIEANEMLIFLTWHVLSNVDGKELWWHCSSTEREKRKEWTSYMLVQGKDFLMILLFDIMLECNCCSLCLQLKRYDCAYSEDVHLKGIFLFFFSSLLSPYLYTCANYNAVQRAGQATLSLDQ